MTDEQPKDKLGRTIARGDFIVYGHALGRSAGLRIGRVLEVSKAKPDRFYCTHSEWRIRVQGVDDDWAPNGEPTLCRPGTLQYPDRAIRLRVEDVPAALFAMLMKATAIADVL